MADKLGIIALKNFSEQGTKIDEELHKLFKHDGSFLIENEIVRFDSGESKAVIHEPVHGLDIFILSDCMNYSETYEARGMKVPVLPGEHYQNLCSMIYTLKGQARRITVITPWLYNARQDKRKQRESLNMANDLRRLIDLGVKNVITFDAHNEVAALNAVPLNNYRNMYATTEIIMEFLDNEKVNVKDLIFISPDTGGIGRARYYANTFGIEDVGIFDKVRDYTNVTHGSNKIVKHTYIGQDVKDKICFIVDDMISSGSSIITVIKELKKRGAEKVFIAVTYALFTKGIDKFETAYKEGILDKIYTTNLIYIPNKIKRKAWLKVVDCNRQIATIIADIYEDEPLTPVLKGHPETAARVREYINKN